MIRIPFFQRFAKVYEEAEESTNVRRLEERTIQQPHVMDICEQRIHRWKRLKALAPYGKNSSAL